MKRNIKYRVLHGSLRMMIKKRIFLEWNRCGACDWTHKKSWNHFVAKLMLCHAMTSQTRRIYVIRDVYATEHDYLKVQE